MRFKKFPLSAILIITAALIFMASGYQNSPEHKVLFEKAKYTMVTKGDLKGAIELFEEIIRKYPDEREFAAKSQYYIGICYQKLGLKEAKTAFQTVLEKYPEQTEAVNLAKEKLTNLVRAKAVIEKIDTELTVQQLLSGPELMFDGWLGEVSPDGQYISVVDWETGDLAIRNLITGKKTRLTNKGSWDRSNEYALYSKWAPDGKQIVYDWWDDKSFIDLRIIHIDEKKPRTIYKNKESSHAYPLYWSPDSKDILIGVTEGGNHGQMALLSVKSGNLSIIEEEWEGINACISPDGNYIAYDKYSGENKLDRNIFLYSIQKQREIPLIEHPANDDILGWSPDGRWILFKSNRLGSEDAWIVPVSDGKAAGDPKLIKKGIEGIHSLGFSQNGSYYYIDSKAMENIYSVSLNPRTGKVQSAPQKMDLPAEGRNRFPIYSPDGKRLAYIRNPLAPQMDRSTLHIRSVDTGEEHVYPFEFRSLFPRWSPDGRTILLTRFSGNRSLGICQFDVQIGTVNPVLMPNLPKKEEYFFNEWAPDGKSLYFVEGQPGPKSSSVICSYDIQTKKRKRIHHTPGWATIFLSPNGKWLAFVGRGDPNRELKVIPANGGEERMLYRFTQSGGGPVFLCWTPDSQDILFFQEKTAKNPEEALCRIPVTGSDVEELGVLSINAPEYLNIHPNGHQIVFSSTGPSINYPEYWVMENFLPKK